MSIRKIALSSCFIMIVVSFVLGLLMLDRQFSNLYDIRKDEAYTAWCKLTGRTDISKDELYSLKRAGLLDGYYTADKPKGMK